LRLAVAKFRVEGETGHGGLESGRFETHAGEFCLHLALHGTPDGRAQKSSHGVCPGHLLQLQDGDEEADLNLSRMWLTREGISGDAVTVYGLKGSAYL